MRKLTINAQDIVFAWQDECLDNAYYLDIESGDTRLVNRNLLELGDLTDEIERDLERFLYIPKPDKNLLIDDLKEFAFTIEDSSLKNILPLAFESPDPVAAFKKILERSPRDRARLDAFIRASLLARVDRWLKANAIDAEFV
ncbi:MAG TPA: UPF0158 family protein [Candidatus Obscuribacterales bacterium]